MAGTGRSTAARRSVTTPSTQSQVTAKSEDTLPSEAEKELTPEQQEILDLKDKLAKAEGAKDPETEYSTVEDPGSQENILIHFVRDGFCDLGVIWYKGQELELEPGTPQYDSAKVWATLDSSEQEDLYGDVYFRKGAWKGKDYEDSDAAKAERKRNRAAPRINH